MPCDGSTEVYGIMGDPVTHSLSPAMHNAAFAHYGMNRVYIPLPVKDVAPAMDGLRALGIKGASVTIPHKQAVIPHLDDIDPLARRIGAVNTLDIRDGRITGYNTDWLGAVNALKEEIPLSGRKALILGAGGSARAIGFGLLQEGATPLIANRSEQRGRALADELGCAFLPLAEAGGADADILVNATSVGMAPNTDIPLPEDGLARFAVVMDIVYAPLETPLLRQAKANGCRVVNGLAMLLRQGAAQFELWTGEPAPLAVMMEPLAARFA